MPARSACAIFVPPCAQRGNTLIVSLLLLLLLSMIGMQGYQTTVLEERMAGNTEDIHRAFQGAEAAILTAEMALEKGISGRAIVARNIRAAWGTWKSSGTAPTVGSDPSFEWSGTGFYRLSDLNASDTWSAGGGNCTGGCLATQPQVVVEEIEELPGVEAGAGSLSPDIPTPAQSKLYRITSSASGGSTNARVVLETIYQR